MTVQTSRAPRPPGTVTTGASAATELSFTGTGAGSTYYVIGGTRYVINVEENHVHNYQVTARTAPTCTEAGSITYTCAACGDSYTQTVPALGHDYDAVVTAPTCGNGGYTTYTCTRCGDSYTEVLPRPATTIRHPSARRPAPNRRDDLYLHRLRCTATPRQRLPSAMTTVPL